MFFKIVVACAVLFILMVALSRWQVFREMIQDLLSIDEARISVLIFMAILTLLFSCCMCVRLGDVPANLTSILQILILCVAGVTGSYTIGSIVQKVTRIKNDVVTGNLPGVIDDIKAGLGSATADADHATVTETSTSNSTSISTRLESDQAGPL